MTDSSQPLLESRPGEPLVARNPFLERTASAPHIEPFADARARLPTPLLPDHPHWVEMYWRAWEEAWSHLRRARPQSGLMANYVNGARGDLALMWDAAHMVPFGTYGRRAFYFMGTLDMFYARQHRDGFMPRAIVGENGAEAYSPFDPDGTGPAILAWAEWLCYRASGDEERLADVFWPLLAYHRWLRAHRTWPGGLYWATGLSSGMDGQDRVPGGEHHHAHWTWVDASIQAALRCQILWQMAELLGERQLVPDLVQERGRLLHEINSRLWSDETAFYHDADPDGHLSAVKSVGAYWALLDPELIPAERLGPFLRHLREASAFRRAHRLPALSADSPGYLPPGRGWRGGVSAATNYMVLKGLRAVGQPMLAHEIAVNHVENVCAVFRRTDTFWEHYAADEVAPAEGALPGFVGSTGLAPIAVLLEEVIGLQIDWPQRRVVWDRRLPVAAGYGVRGLPLGRNGSLDLWADAEALTVTSNTPFTLTLLQGEARLQMAVAAGTTRVPLS